MNKTKLVIIDDDVNVRKTLSAILGSKGYEMFTAKTGAEGIELCRRHAVHVALIDLLLPDMPGLEVLKTVRTECPSTQAIILTGNATLDSAIEATNRGAYSYLLKPYDVEQLLLHIRHAVDKIEAEDKLTSYREHLEELVRERTAELEKEIIERKRAEVEIRKLNEHLKQHIAKLEEARMLADAGIRARGAFLANISHELITPLNSIIGFSQILIDGLGGPMNDQQKEYTESILLGGNRLHETLREIVQFAGLESGEMQLHADRFLLKDLLKSSLLAFNEKAAVQGVALSLENGMPPETELDADRGKLQQALFNLLDNAVKFTPGGGSVRVHARRVRSMESGVRSGKDGSERDSIYSEFITQNPGLGRDFMEISVADTGIGIKEEDLPGLFSVFQQLESPYTKKFKGTGLGLMLAKKLVELHGGKIWVESEFGKGSTFTLAIPMSRKTEGGGVNTD